MEEYINQIEYKPFEVDNFLETQKVERCYYCNKSIHANCHAHKDSRCPYSCGYINPTPVGDGIIIMIGLILVYTLIKIFKQIKLNIK